MRDARADEFQVTGVLDRVAPYDISVGEADEVSPEPDELVERAATLLLVMPPNQRRTTIEELLSPDDPARGRRAVDALIASAFAVEDETGHLRRTG